MLSRSFGPPGQWPDQDLIGYSSEFDASITMAAYHCGVFPMPVDLPEHGAQMGWWSPMRRGVLPVDRLRVTRSMRASARRFETTIDLAFEEVLDQCADPRRPGGWIAPEIASVYSQLHSIGIAHSVETWDAAGRLTGGLYGVCVGRLFAGESMFHDQTHGRDASKVALMRLVAFLRPEDALLDVQWATPHLTSLGAIEVSRERYLTALSAALEAPAPAWPDRLGSRMPGDELLRLLDARPADA